MHNVSLKPAETITDTYYNLMLSGINSLKPVQFLKLILQYDSIGNNDGRKVQLVQYEYIY